VTAEAPVINYEVTVEDPKIFSMPWMMAMPLYRTLVYQAFDYMS
jgi:hypothetical protein